MHNRFNPRKKLWVMLDSQGNKIAGISRLAVKQPKNGLWVSEEPSFCCTTTSTTTTSTTTTTTTTTLP
jgi:hypothetical protein